MVDQLVYNQIAIAVDRSKSTPPTTSTVVRYYSSFLSFSCSGSFSVSVSVSVSLSLISGSVFLVPKHTASSKPTLPFTLCFVSFQTHVLFCS
ncbi:hypothetical protein LOK49_LG11G01917 [Camellia lanceoleosa]|uniref:Uncharacterized protein n=1 Tax=Camellia lanceoleosa TaxID=1840588 RepID=A0ACC0G0V5_9ERIC|nr:hypothetical protein LOK49_LG11G01917 [Camellia lanceoleosa]